MDSLTYCAQESDAYGAIVNITLSFITSEDERETLQVLEAQLDVDSAFREGWARLLESYWGQVHIKTILSVAGYDDNVFYVRYIVFFVGLVPGRLHVFPTHIQGYLHSLRLDDPEASHEAVMSDAWRWFEEKTDPSTVRKLRVAFAEEEATQLGEHIPLNECIR